MQTRKYLSSPSRSRAAAQEVSTKSGRGAAQLQKNDGRKDRMSTTADIYSHLDANATGEAGMKLGKLLADDESEVG